MSDFSTFDDESRFERPSYPMGDMSPDGSPFPHIEEKWRNDRLFSEMTADLPDIGVDNPANTTAAIHIVEAGFRVLDSPLGEAALSVAFSGLGAVERLRHARDKMPPFGQENITDPLAADALATPKDLARHTQRARYLHVSACPEPGQDVDAVRGHTLAGALLTDAQKIASTSKDPMSFDEALALAVAKRTPADGDIARSYVLDVARETARGRFDQVSLEAMIMQASPES